MKKAKHNFVGTNVYVDKNMFIKAGNNYLALEQYIRLAAEGMIK